MKVMIKVGSHRARQKLFQLLGKLQCYFSWDTSCTGGFYMIDDADLNKALEITGISKASPKFKYNECFDFQIRKELV